MSILNKIILKSIYPFGIIRTKINYQPFSKVYVFPQKLIPNQELLKEFKITKIINLMNLMV